MIIRNKKFVYIASPFSHEDVKIRDERVEAVERFVAHCNEHFYKEHVFFSPIAHSGHSYKLMPEEFHLNFGYWIKEVDDYFLDIAEELWVLMIDGWDRSKGTKYEIAKAHEKEVRIKYFKVQATGGIPAVTYICVKDEI